MKNFVENQGIKTDKPLAMSYEALKAERDAQQKRADALAVENVALKSAHPQPFGREMMKALDSYEKHQDEVPETGMLDAFFILRDSIRVETPATDSALAAIRDAVLDRVIAKLGAMGSPDFTLMAVRALKNELREAK